jgi:hypothetical protein
MSLDDDLLNRIAMNIDSESSSKSLRLVYSKANSQERGAIDIAFLALTGWTLKTLIEQADGFEEEEEE